MYELAILGCPPEAARARIVRTIQDMVADFGLVVGHDLLIHDANSLDSRNPHSPFAAVYFGNPNKDDEPVVRNLTRFSIPIIPTIGPTSDSHDELPIFLQHLNILRRRDDDPNMTTLVSALLESIGLLRPQRRVFLSYRRTEAHAAASQLHDMLTARGFDVFLDTHELRPGEPFQDTLWHRLCDSDVMLMLDTPTYFSSKWTRQEFARTLVKNIHVLRVVWPDHYPERSTDLAQTFYLDADDLEGPIGPLVKNRVNDIANSLEKLRARSLVARYRALNGQLRLELQKVDATLDATGTHHSMTVRLSDDRTLFAYPIVGIPTAESLHEVEKTARRIGIITAPALIYDHVGIRDAWSTHLEWLGKHVKTVRAIKVSEAAWSIAAWES